jgi:hypothetical protein
MLTVVVSSRMNKVYAAGGPGQPEIRRAVGFLAPDLARLADLAHRTRLRAKPPPGRPKRGATPDSENRPAGQPVLEFVNPPASGGIQGREARKETVKMIKKTIPVLAAALTAALALPACAEDPVLATDLIVITLSDINENDITSGVVEERKNISTESGNPYGEFLREARRILGRDPGRIRVESVQITLDGSSRGVDGFQDLFPGEVNVFLDASAGGTVYVGRTSAPTGMGPVVLSVISSDDSLAPIMDALLGGSFHVGVQGATHRLEHDDFDAGINIRIGFGAYE